MKRILYFLAGLLAILLVAVAMSAPAHAQTPCAAGSSASDAARLCWINATENTNATPIPASGPTALRETQVRRSICNADGTFGAAIQTITVTPDVLTVLFEGLPPARHCFQARHVNNSDATSAWSGVVSKTTTAPAPPRPRQPNVTIA